MKQRHLFSPSHPLAHPEIIPKHSTLSTGAKTKDKLKLIIIKLLLVALENACDDNCDEVDDVVDVDDDIEEVDDVVGGVVARNSGLIRLRRLSVRCRRAVHLLYGSESRICWLKNDANYEYIMGINARLTGDKMRDSLLLEFVGENFSLHCSY